MTHWQTTCAIRKLEKIASQNVITVMVHDVIIMTKYHVKVLSAYWSKFLVWPLHRSQFYSDCDETPHEYWFPHREEAYWFWCKSVQGFLKYAENTSIQLIVMLNVWCYIICLRINNGSPFTPHPQTPNDLELDANHYMSCFPLVPVTSRNKSLI